MSAATLGGGALLALALLLAGCSDDGPAAPAAGTATPAAPAPGTSAPGTPAPPPAPLPPAGPAEAATVAGLPDGPATGSVLVRYGGLGELRAPFAGTCTSDGTATTLRGTADTARLEVTFSPGGAELTLDDAGLVATSSLGRGEVAVTGPHLALRAPLAQDGQVVGSVELDLDCAG